MGKLKKIKIYKFLIRLYELFYLYLLNLWYISIKTEVFERRLSL